MMREGLESLGSDRRAGFMLVEVLIAMAISAFLLVALASVTRLAFQAFERTQATSDRVEAKSRLFATLVRDLGRVPRWRWAGDRGFAFAGGPSEIFYGSVRFTADGSSQPIIVHLQNIAETTGGAVYLMRSVADFVPGMSGFDDLAFSPPELMSRQAGGLRFAYYEWIDGDADILTDAWTTIDALPVAIRVLATDQRGEAFERALRIPILITAEPACALAGSQDCSLRPIEPMSPGAPDAAEAIDPDDPLGWMRYAR